VIARGELGKMGSAEVNGSAEGVNLAAYVCGINDLKVQPYELPAVLGKDFTSFSKAFFTHQLFW
jgi:hypothetical protein